MTSTSSSCREIVSICHVYCVCCFAATSSNQPSVMVIVHLEITSSCFQPRQANPPQNKCSDKTSHILYSHQRFSQSPLGWPRDGLRHQTVARAICRPGTTVSALWRCSASLATDNELGLNRVISHHFANLAGDNSLTIVLQPYVILVHPLNLAAEQAISTNSKDENAVCCHEHLTHGPANFDVTPHGPTTRGLVLVVVLCVLCQSGGNAGQQWCDVHHKLVAIVTELQGYQTASKHTVKYSKLANASMSSNGEC